VGEFHAGLHGFSHCCEHRLMTRTLFEVFWYGMCAEARDAWVKRSIWALARALEKTYWSRALLETADDVVIYTLERLLSDPTGEYAPHGETTAEDYFRRCQWLRVKAVERMARASKRRFIGPNHEELDDTTGQLTLPPETPETVLAERESMAEARETIGRAVAKSRLRGVTREYAENFVDLAAQGLSTADIARRLNTNEGNVRSARLKLMRLLVREGVIEERTARAHATDDRMEDSPEAPAFEGALPCPVVAKRRH
jgi:DNA-directed RNA polymerase specialized sigma24 family protein